MKLELKGPDNAPFEPGKDFSVMVAFDDDVTARRADDVLGLLEQNLKEEEGRLFHQWWNIDVLAFTSMGELAALEAAMADMIIIAIHDGQELPKTVAIWMKRFLDRRKDRPGALMAMLDSDPNKLDITQGVLPQLKQAAALGRMSFFATRVGSGGDKMGMGRAGGDDGMTRVACEAATQFVMASKSRARHKHPRAANVLAETCGAWTS